MTTKKIILLLSIMILHFFSNIYCMHQRTSTSKDNQLTARQMNKKEKRKHRHQQEKDYLKQVEKNETPCDPLCCLCCPLAAFPFPIGIGLIAFMDYTSKNDIMTDISNYFNGTQS